MVCLDHAIVLVRDLSLAASHYQRLGFTLTPRGAHPKLGTANHTIMLERDYIELLAVVSPGPANARWALPPDRVEGLGAIALETNDAAATAQTLRSRGIDVPPVIEFERPVELASGSVAARFSVALLPAEASPAVPAFFCQHHTPQHVWRPEWQQHANTAAGLVGLTVVHPNPKGIAAVYERLLGRASVHPHPGGVTLELRTAKLWLVTRDYAEARLGAHLVIPPDGIQPIGLTVAVRDLAAARRVLTANGVHSDPFGRGSILVGPSWTRGVYLELLPA